MCVVGIYVCYMAHGVAQEAIFKTGDKEAGDTFMYPIFLVFMVSVGSAISAFVVNAFNANFDTKKVFMVLYQAPKASKDTKEMDISRPVLNKEIVMDFFLIALSYIGAMLAGNYALTQVNYPTQVLVKSAKMVPIVIGGLILFRKTYPWYDYVAVAVVTTSLIVFNVAKSQTKAEAASTALGVFLCFLSLFCDGLTGPRQDKVNSRFVVKAFEHMMFTNLAAIIPSALAMLIFEGTAPWTYCERYPEVIQHIAVYCVCNTLGQLFIFQALTAFGALYLALITTTRKFFTVMFSVFWFGHNLNLFQWTSVVAIFSALLMQSYYSQMDKAKKKGAAGAPAKPAAPAQRKSETESLKKTDVEGGYGAVPTKTAA